MPWPQRIPPDFHAAIADRLSYRATPNPQDFWLDLVDLFEKHGMEAPDSLPVERDEGPEFYDQ